MKTKTPNLKFYKGKSGKHRWRLKHGNGKVLSASSQGFTRRAGAIRNFVSTRIAMNAIMVNLFRGARGAAAVAAAAIVLIGCAHQLDRGADPLVVRVEQASTTGKAAFDLVLNIDHADRGFWRTNAPAFHQFCAWLREPQMTTATVNSTPVTLPRCSAMLWSLDQTKIAYKHGLESSNRLWTALLLVNETAKQAEAWRTITKGK